MRFLFADFETRWARKEGHTLSKMLPFEYVLDPRTELQVLTYAWGNEPVQTLVGEGAIKAWSAEQDWSDVWVISHNAAFDALILAWRLGVVPKMWGCTLSMARPFFGKTAGGSLKAVAEALGLPPKGSLDSTGTEGLYVRQWSAAQRQAILKYGGHDTWLCREIFRALVPHTPKSELQLIHINTRMLVEPVLEIDEPLLRRALVAEQARKVEAIDLLSERLDLPAPEVQKVLMSNPKFAGLLEDLGVEPPTKLSTATGKETYAFAKTDDGMLDLLEHDDALVRAAVETRLGVKSSILETRIETFLRIAAACNNKMPVPLLYFGAANSGRYSGAICNLQNLSRVNTAKPKPSDVLRQSLRAPKGYKLVASDLSGIEMRVLHFMWNVPSSIKAFQEDPEADLYRLFGSTLYHCAPEDITKDQRQLAKAAMLGLQYGAGPKTFHRVAKLQGVKLSLEEIEKVVEEWRRFYTEICRGWRAADAAIQQMAVGDNPMNVDPRGLVRAYKGELHLPRGIVLRYPHLRQEDDKGRLQWVYGEGRHKQKIYGSKLVENITQAISRIFLTDAILKIDPIYPSRHHVHDEVIVVVPDDEAEDALDEMNAILRTPPEWFPDIVLFSEGSIGSTYAEAK